MVMRLVWGLNPSGTVWNREKNLRLWSQINLPLGNWVTLSRSLFYLDPGANVISSVPAKPSPDNSEAKKNLFIQ